MFFRWDGWNHQLVCIKPYRWCFHWGKTGNWGAIEGGGWGFLTWAKFEVTFRRMKGRYPGWIWTFLLIFVENFEGKRCARKSFEGKNAPKLTIIVFHCASTTVACGYEPYCWCFRNLKQPPGRVVTTGEFAGGREGYGPSGSCHLSDVPCGRKCVNMGDVFVKSPGLLKIYPGWWQLKYFLCSALFGEDSHFNQYFSNGLKPPTSISHFLWGGSVT